MRTLVGSTHPMTAARARVVFLVLTGTRWLPVGIAASSLVLWQLEGGLSIAQALTMATVGGVAWMLLELPTSGFADAFGRRAVYLASAMVNAAAAVLLVSAHSVWTFALAALLGGVFRALESGPLEAWFVDTVHAEDPDADLSRPLSAQSMILGGSIALGALISALLVRWHPLADHSALWLAYVCYAGLCGLHLVAVLVLLREPPVPHQVGPLDGVRRAPAIIVGGIRLAIGQPVLRGLLLVEVGWALAMLVFESFMPIRLAELTGGEERAAVWMGPVTAVGWGVFSLGAWLSGRASARLGVAVTAISARVLNGLGALVMGLMGAPWALVIAYLVTYSLHGFAGPAHLTLLHGQARSENRATVLSINSMLGSASYAVAAPLFGLLAERTSTPWVMLLAGGLSVLGALGYAPALRARRDPTRLPRAADPSH